MTIALNWLKKVKKLKRGIEQWQGDAKNNPKYLEGCDFIGKVLANS